MQNRNEFNFNDEPNADQTSHEPDTDHLAPQPELLNLPPKPNPFGAPPGLRGRDASARNAIRHGCCADGTLILSHERLEDFHALEQTWLNSYHPQDAGETRLVHQLIQADWLLERANRALIHAEAHLFENGYLATNWSEDQHKKLTRFTRYQTARANSVAKCRKAIDDYRKARLTEQNNSSKVAITKERLKTAQHKNHPTTPRHHQAVSSTTTTNATYSPTDTSPS